ncbi:MAG: LppX_LprAFG lipoprotein [Chloroflexi bacterium]|nr:LppX_LprAFG lipoprotein [Chloroflexota bacterium]
MRRSVKLWSLLLLIVVMVLGACNGEDGDEESPPEPQELLTEAAQSLNEAESFRLGIRHEGPSTEIDAGEFVVIFNNATAFFVSPDRVWAKVSVAIGDLTQEVEVIAIEDRQYINNSFLTGGEWQAEVFAQGFQPSDLQSDEKGIGSALLSMDDAELLGREEIAGGVAVYHLRGTVDAQKVRSVTVGLMASDQGAIETEVYIRRDDTRRVARIVLKEPTETDEVKIWTIDFDSYNRDFEIEEPDIP